MTMPAVFLDRDGTIFEDTGYPGDSSHILFINGVPEALRKLQKHFLLIIISNQSGVGRGLLTLDEMYRVQQKMVAKLETKHIEITDTYFCPHAPEDDCDCRKPSPEMIINAAEKWNIDLNQSFMVGDKLSDTVAGSRAGCRSILLQKGKKNQSDLNDPTHPDYIAPDFKAAAKWILSRLENNPI